MTMKKKNHFLDYAFSIEIKGATNGVMVEYPTNLFNSIVWASEVCTTKEQILARISRQLDLFYERTPEPKDDCNC
jgi:hypothetical protein